MDGSLVALQVWVICLEQEKYFHSILGLSPNPVSFRFLPIVFCSVPLIQPLAFAVQSLAHEPYAYYHWS